MTDMGYVLCRSLYGGHRCTEPENGAYYTCAYHRRFARKGMPCGVVSFQDKVCEKPIQTRGLCYTHYRQVVAAGKAGTRGKAPVVTVNPGKCLRCNRSALSRQRCSLHGGR